MSTAPTLVESAEMDDSDTYQGLTPLEVAKQIRQMRYQFLGPRVIIMRDPMDTKIGSLYLPQTGQVEKRSGTILSLGLGIWADAQTDKDGAQAEAILDVVEPGMKTLFGRYEAIQLTVKLLEKSVRLDFLHWRDLYVVAPCNKADKADWDQFNFEGVGQ